MDVKKILFDTDIGGDCDDAGALALLHRLCDRGEAELLAVTACYASPYVAGCIDAINRYYGREVPVGIFYGATKEDRGSYAGLLCDTFPSRYPSAAYGTAEAAPDSVSVLRRALSQAEDDSVTFVVTGSLATAAALAVSAGDEISPLGGRELICKKIHRTVVMGGRFFESWPMGIHANNEPGDKLVDWEWNIRESVRDAQTVCRLWPGELVFSSYEIGTYIKTMVGYNTAAPQDDPVRLAYHVYSGGEGRCSWDHTAILDAVRPDTYWHYHAYGRITVDDEGVTRFVKDPDTRHTYLLPRADYEEIRAIIDGLVFP